MWTKNDKIVPKLDKVQINEPKECVRNNRN